MAKFHGWRYIISILAFCVSLVSVLSAQTVTPLFYFGPQNGEAPEVPPVQGLNGNFYGTTLSGGSTYGGVVYEVTAAGKYSKLYNFCSQTGCTDGSSPEAALVQATDGNLYGTTKFGGANDQGTVFRITQAGVLTTLYSFCSQPNCADGEDPSTLIAANGVFYGTTPDGGAYGGGTVFKITRGGQLTTLYSFCPLGYGNCTDGEAPHAGLVQGINGNFYGTTYEGGTLWDEGGCTEGAGCGTVFEITPAGTLTTLYKFCSQANCADGQWPDAPLVQGTNGNIYGTTSEGGTPGANCPAYGGCGTFFEINPAGNVTFPYSFCAQPNCTDGDFPNGIVQGSDGNIYGTTNSTVFEMGPTGNLIAIYPLCATCGAGPLSGLMQSTNGVFYGTAVFGGARTCDLGCGTIFSLSTGLAPFAQTLPTSGAVGNQIGILGNNLTGTTKVSFNGTPATFKVTSPTLITTRVPSGATTGPVKLTLPSGTLVSNIPFYVVP